MFIPGPPLYIFRQDRIFYYLINKSVTFDMILFIFYAISYALFSLSFLCFQMQCFQYISLCFQYQTYVSNIQIMFPNAILCFQYPIFVSNIQSMFPNANDVSKRQCFQCMFPIYIEPLKSVRICQITKTKHVIDYSKRN